MQSVLLQGSEVHVETKVERFFRLLYEEHMNEYPKRRQQRDNKIAKYTYAKNRPWVYLGAKQEMRAVATFYTLFKKLYDDQTDTTYYTPNSFFRGDKRQANCTRWIHALQIDIDVKNSYTYQSGLSVVDIFERCESAGLPRPTAIIKTPSGGFQPIWFLEKAVRATAKSNVLFEAIQKHVASDLGGDDKAIGVERIFRTPTEENLVYFNPTRTSFQQLVDWRQINHPLSAEQHHRDAYIQKNDIMRHPAVLRLYSQEAGIGQRESSCFTLTLAMKFSGYSEDQALEEMMNWWSECCEKGYGRNSFTLRDVVYRVRRIYRRGHLQVPSAEEIRRLTGMDFSYGKFRFITPRKPREERKYVHKSEWQTDLLELLRQEQGKLDISMPKLAERLGCAVSSLKLVIKDLQESGVIEVVTKRGRGGSTAITLVDFTNDAEDKNSQISNTIGEEEGGGSPVDSWGKLLYHRCGLFSTSILDLFTDLYTSACSALPVSCFDEWFLAMSSALDLCTRPGVPPSSSSGLYRHLYTTLLAEHDRILIQAIESD